MSMYFIVRISRLSFVNFCFHWLSFALLLFLFCHDSGGKTKYQETLMLVYVNCCFDGYTQAIGIYRSPFHLHIYQSPFRLMCFWIFKHRIAWCRLFLALQRIRLVADTVLNTYPLLLPWEFIIKIFQVVRIYLFCNMLMVPFRLLLLFSNVSRKWCYSAVSGVFITTEKIILSYFFHLFRGLVLLLFFALVSSIWF